MEDTLYITLLVCKTKGHFNYIANLNRSNKIVPIRHLQGLL